MDASSKDDYDKARQKEKVLRNVEINDIRYLLNDVRGRRFLWRYLERCHIYLTSFTANSNQTAFNEGERLIGLELMGDINDAEPEKFILMMNENKKETKEEENV